MQLSEGTAQQLVDRLYHAQDIASEARILRRIKNDVTGHELRKIAYIRAGLVPALSEALLLRSSSPPDDTSFYRAPVDEEAIWWHASSIVIVIANAGPAFTFALLDSSILSLLIARLRIADPTERLTLNLLCALNTIAENLPLDDGSRWTADQTLAKALYVSENSVCLSRLVAVLPDTRPAQQRLEAVLTLICNTCRSEKHVSLLADAGLLETLSGHLATQILRQEYGTPGDIRSVHVAEIHGLVSYQTLVLETLALILEHSKSRTQDFATNIDIERALIMTMGTADTLQRLAPHGILPADIAIDEQAVSYDFPLPLVPDLHAMYLAKRSVWPPLSQSADSQMAPRRQSSIKTIESTNPTPQESWIELDQERVRNTAIVPWLLYVARSADKGTRVMAARLLVILKTHQMLNGKTMRSLSTLLVPILVDMLDKQTGFSSLQFPYAERVPAILALLVKDQEYLQQAAVEARAIPRLAAALKANFESAEDMPSELWWPTKLQEKLSVGTRDRSLGPGGPSRRKRMQMFMREGLLQALGALAPDSDVFRKDICDQGALNHIVLALEPFHTRTVSGEHCDRIAVAGNSSEALIAACGAVRALTRSPTSLRTKLVDADVAKHVVNLLYTGDLTVRIAATKVVANLSHGFSPMKNHIAETAVIKKLCEQAHSANAELRKETLFALKAFINLSSNKLKRSVIEELGVKWIRKIIATDPHDVPNGEIIGLTEKDYRKGSMVRVSDDTDMYDAGSIESEQEIEEYNRHTLEEDLEILAELLGFIRNLTTGDQPLEIIDILFEEIGCEEFLQIIIDRLKASTNSQSPSSGKIIQNCVYIVAHLAIADAKYRTPIARNLVLMKQVNTLLGHNDAVIRRACCWLIIGVIYSTTESHLSAVARAKDLQRLGIVANLRRMEKNDLDTDVKERASTACDVFTKLLDKS